MNGIPLPLITEAGAEQQISQIVDHLNALAQETERMFSSIDFKNLNADLANRINSSLTEHQSLEEYASSAKLEKVREELDGLVTEHRDYVNNNFYTQAQMLKTFCTLGYLQANYWEKNEADGYFAKKSYADATYAKRESDSYVTVSEYNELINKLNELTQKVSDLEQSGV